MDLTYEMTQLGKEERKQQELIHKSMNNKWLSWYYQIKIRRQARRIEGLMIREIYYYFVNGMRK
jgi:hypothetical protein